MKEIKNKYLLIPLILIVLILLYLGIKYYMLSNNTINSDNVLLDNMQKVSYNDKYYYLPKDYKYEYVDREDANALRIYGSDSTWSAFIYKIPKDKFDYNIFEDYHQLQNSLIDSGFGVNNERLIELDNRECILFDYYYLDVSKALIAYFKDNSNDIYEITIYQKDDDSEFTVLRKIIDLFK